MIIDKVDHKTRDNPQGKKIPSTLFILILLQ